MHLVQYTLTQASVWHGSEFLCDLQTGKHVYLEVPGKVGEIDVDWKFATRILLSEYFPSEMTLDLFRNCQCCFFRMSSRVSR